MGRTLERIRAHYEVERELASRLKNAPPEERKKLYPLVYEELYRRVPDHPRNSRKYDPARTRDQVQEKLAFLERFLDRETRFLEIGAGDCSLTLTVAGRVKQAYAFDVAYQLRDGVAQPENFRLVIMPDGCSIPLETASVDLAYSNQVMEHIHPDDAYEQLREIYRVLAPGGRYICITPNKAAGPHDVSRHFDDEATCFHLIEYRMKDLVEIFRRAGFTGMEAFAGVRGSYSQVSLSLIQGVEGALLSLPSRIRRPLANAPVFRNLLSLNVVGVKSA